MEQQMQVMKFGSSPHEIDELANKVLTGEKTATSSLFDFYLNGQKKMSQIGELFSVLNSTDEEIAIVRIEKIEKIKFRDITESFAIAEGDGSLDNWLAIHESYYSKLLSEIGFKLTGETMLICEYFRVVNPIL